jgi:hypothetical protein
MAHQNQLLSFICLPSIKLTTERRGSAKELLEEVAQELGIIKKEEEEKSLIPSSSQPMQGTAPKDILNLFLLLLYHQSLYSSYRYMESTDNVLGTLWFPNTGAGDTSKKKVL